MSLTWRSTILSLTIPAWKLQPNACWQVAVRWSVHVERHCQCYSLSTSYRMWQPPIAEHHRSLVERAVRSLQYCPAIIIRRSRARLTVHCRTRSRDPAGCRRGQTTASGAAAALGEHRISALDDASEWLVRVLLLRRHTNGQPTCISDSSHHKRNCCCYHEYWDYSRIISR